jgi:hypothetical protein
MTYPFDHLEGIREARIIQEDLHTLRVLVAPWDKLTGELRALLVQKLHYFLGATRMAILIEEIPALPRTEGGKSPFVISHVKVDEYL